MKLCCGRTGFWLAVFLLLPSPLRGATLTTIFTNGPTARRLNLVFLAEGYTAAQQGRFFADATNAANRMLSVAPYGSYRRFFNAFAIGVASAQAGSDHPSRNDFRNTYFNSSYDSYGIERLVTIPPNDLDSDYAHGEGKVVSLLRSLIPEYDLAVMLVNDPQYGGSGGSSESVGRPVLVSRHEDAAELIRHESAHAFGALGDEYESSYPGFPETEEPNTTRTKVRNSIKWRAWIEGTTPVPTPDTAAFARKVGLFEGAHYHETGWYRPRANCRMRTLGQPFCEVCGEALVRAIHRKLRSGARPLIQETLPTPGTITLTRGARPAFNLTLLEPQGPVGIQWTVNSVAVDGATNAVFELDTQPMVAGAGSLEVEVRDLTQAVRTDLGKLLVAKQSWSVIVEEPHLELSEAREGDGGVFVLQVTGAVPQGFVLQRSVDLRSWLPVLTNELVQGRFDYTNSDVSSATVQFIRAVTWP